MRTLTLCAAMLLALTARAESLPSMHLPWAAQAAASIVVVEEGNVAEVWAGDAKVGESFAAAVKPATLKVAYGFLGDSPKFDKLIDEDLRKKGLKRVASVSGKRMLYFVLPSSPYEGVAQMISRDPAYTTVWLQEGQAFAIQQWMNPGPADLRALELTESQLKQAVLDLREVSQRLRLIDQEKSDAQRSTALAALLKPHNRWWNEEVKQSLRIRSKTAWPAIEPLIKNEKYLPLHSELIYLAYEFARQDARPLFEQVVAEETEYFRKLDVSGEKYDREQPPHVDHERRRAAAQWALDSK